MNSPIDDDDDDEDDDDLKLFARVSPCLFLNPGESRTGTFGGGGGGETRSRFWISGSFVVEEEEEDDLVLKENLFFGSNAAERVSRLCLRSDADLREDRTS